MHTPNLGNMNIACFDVFPFKNLMLTLCFGISRYLSYVMDVATPTADCLILVHDLLLPVIMKSRGKNTLSHQEVHLFFNTEWVDFMLSDF